MSVHKNGEKYFQGPVNVTSVTSFAMFGTEDSPIPADELLAAEMRALNQSTALIAPKHESSSYSDWEIANPRRKIPRCPTASSRKGEETSGEGGLAPKKTKIPCIRLLTKKNSKANP